MNWINAIIQGLMLGGLFALFACGLSLLFGVLGIINLAHGDLAVLGAYVAVALLPSVHSNALWALLFVPPMFAIFGYGAQRTLLQRSMQSGPLTRLPSSFCQTAWRMSGTTGEGRPPAAMAAERA